MKTLHDLNNHVIIPKWIQNYLEDCISDHKNFTHFTIEPVIDDWEIQSSDLLVFVLWGKVENLKNILDVFEVNMFEE